MVARGLDLDRLLRISRHPTVAALGRARPSAAADRPAHRRRQGCRLRLPLRERARRMAAAGCRARHLLAACGRGAGSRCRRRLSAGRLSRSFTRDGWRPTATFMDGLAAAAGRGAAVYGECGGYMVLGRALVDRAGDAHANGGPPAGRDQLPPAAAASRLSARHRSRQLAARARPAQFRGHEFHYGRETRNDGAPLFTVQDARGRDLGQMGCRSGRVMGSFIHLIDRAP